MTDRRNPGLETLRTATWLVLALVMLGTLTRPLAVLHAQDGEACTVTSVINVNRRAGPSTFFTVLKVLPPGQAANVHGQVRGADNYTWWQLEDGSWVRSDAVAAHGLCEAVPRVLASGTPGEDGRQAFFAGMALYGIDDYESALPELERARDLFVQAEMPEREVLVLLPLGEIYQALGQLDQARTTLEDALTLWRAGGDSDGEAVALLALGAVYEAQNVAAQALDVSQQALDIQVTQGNRGGQAVALHAIGQIYFEQAQYTEALDAFQRALPIWFEVSSREGAARTLQAIGDTYYAQNANAEAVSQYGQALSLWQSVGNKQSEAETLLGLSQAFTALGDTEQAAAYEARAQALLAEPVVQITATPSN